MWWVTDYSDKDFEQTCRLIKRTPFWAALAVGLIGGIVALSSGGPWQLPVYFGASFFFIMWFAFHMWASESIAHYRKWRNNNTH